MKCHLLVATIYSLSLPALAQIPQITHLKDGSKLPESISQKYKVNEIAEALVLRQHLHHEKNTHGTLDYSGLSEIYLSFNSAHTASIIKDAEILNAHQTAQGATFNDDLKLRTKLEDALIGIELGNSEKSKRLRPKYAYLQTNGLENYPRTTFNPNYGNIFARINDQIKQRATFTIGDSMDEGRSTLHTFRFKDRIQLSVDFSRIPYWEAQVWGELKLQDVDYFLVNCPGFPSAAQKDIKTMLDAGLKLYFCSMDKNRQNIQRLKAVTMADLNSFLATEDKQAPSISNFKHSTKNGHLIVSFEAKDDQGINFCLIKAYHQQELLLDDEISVRVMKTKNKLCEFEIEKPKLPLKIKLYVKDWYTNQTTTTEVIK